MSIKLSQFLLQSHCTITVDYGGNVNRRIKTPSTQYQYHTTAALQ